MDELLPTSHITESIAPSKIQLYFANGQAYVWNAEDWDKLRRGHRIIGELIGTIASKPRQDAYQGFPMVLLTEETALLIEEGLAELVECTNIKNPPDQRIKDLAKDYEDRLFNEQIDDMKEKRIEQISSKIDVIVAGKQKKLAKEGKSIEVDKDELMKEEISKLAPLSVEYSLCQVFNEHPWPLETNPVSIDRLVPNLSSDIGKVRYRVFKDLWKRGYHITAGTKFGADFLAYLGDPEKFHAAFMVRCLKCKSSEIAITDFVTFGRLGVSVNKLPVYAYLNGENLVYQTVRWYETLH